MTDNKLLASKSQRYEIVASNGQVIEHSFTSQKATLSRIREIKKTYPNERFTIRGYDKGKYTED